MQPADRRAHSHPREQTDLYASPAHRDVRDALLQALLSWRAELADVEWLHANMSGNAKVAGPAAAHTHVLRGSDAEQRLNEAAARIDAETQR